MSTKSDPQRRQTHEQLRLEHILVLEELQRCKDENEQLRDQLKLRSDPPKIVIQADKSETLSEYVDKIRKQEKEIADLKALAKKTAMEDQQRFNQIHTRAVEEFSQQVAKMQSKERELNSQLDALQRQLESIPLLESRILQLEEEKKVSKLTIQSLRGEVTETNQHVQALTSQLLASQNAQRDAEASNLELQAALASSSSCVKCAQTGRELRERDQRLADCELQLLERARTADEMGEQVARLTGELFDCKCKLNDAINEVIRLHGALQHQQQLQQQKAVSFKDSDSEGEDGEAAGEKKHGPPPQPAPLPQQPVHLSPQQLDDDDNACVVSAHSMSVRFQEYIRLKRENKELKLRLADLHSHAGGSKIQKSRSAANMQVMSGSHTSQGGGRTVHSNHNVRLPKLHKLY